MTQQTRNDLLNLLDSTAEIDQAVMDAYLAPFATREEYEHAGKLRLHYFAVLAAAEYHEHWARITEHAETLDLSRKMNLLALELVNRGVIPGDAEYLRSITGASTVTETPFDSRFERVVK